MGDDHEPSEPRGRRTKGARRLLKTSILFGGRCVFAYTQACHRTLSGHSSGLDVCVFNMSQPLMKRLCESWGLFKRYSQLPVEPLRRVVLSTCKLRSQNMAAQLMELVRTKRTDFYSETIGPLHLHGVLAGLEQNRMSYLL